VPNPNLSQKGNHNGDPHDLRSLEIPEHNREDAGQPEHAQTRGHVPPERLFPRPLPRLARLFPSVMPGTVAAGYDKLR